MNTFELDQQAEERKKKLVLKDDEIAIVEDALMIAFETSPFKADQERYWRVKLAILSRMAR